LLLLLKVIRETQTPLLLITGLLNVSTVNNIQISTRF